MSNEQVQAPKLNASQRIENLEASLRAMDMALYNIAQEVSKLSRDNSGLATQIDTLVSMLESKEEISKSNIEEAIINNKIERMAQSVNEKVASGVLTASEEIGPHSFVVGFETLTATGDIHSKRVQFAMFSIDEVLSSILSGKKVGDTVGVSETISFTIKEIYEIKTQQQAQAAQEQTPVTE